MLVLMAVSAASTLLEDSEICWELALMPAKRASRLEDEFESESDEVVLVVIEVLTELSEASTLDEERERLMELPLTVARAVSTLDDDDERLSEEP